ncbi:hypothetical protein [Teichococcus deserti]|uniref:hypothetical protein n=1 Tax=Teichococcus deserti TaxID=1817963 RepID=UPI001F617D4D|nr:hypothetical protein [Pseudoroseomonas deserti]
MASTSHSGSSLGGRLSLGETELPATYQSPVSAISWGAILGGAAGAAAVSLILVLLGTGFGLAIASPWSGPTATAVGVTAAVWLVITQWLSSGIGGYIAGRLRTHWASVHADEVYFRDTAHGFLAWAVATLVTVGVLASAASGAIGAGARAVSAVGGGAVQAAASTAGPALARSYDIDSLFRRAQPVVQGEEGQAAAEAGRIIANGIAQGEVPEADRAYLAQLVAARAEIPPAEARSRVDAAVTRAQQAAEQAKQAAETARKSAATTALFTALSMLIGAFIAATAAALAGRSRDT